jgi:hypothetical protein
VLDILKRWWQWLSAIDAALSWAGRIWMGYLLLTSTGVGLFVGGLAWLFQNFVYGIWAFLGTWVLVTALQAFRVIKHSPSPSSAATQPITEESQAQVREVEQAEARAAENADSGQVGIHTITLGTDERPLVEDHELQDKVYERRSLWMAEFARKIAPSGTAQAVIRDRRFYDCRIYGPVVFGPLGRNEINGVFVDCEWIEEQPIVFWPTAEAREEYVGAVRLEDCRFEGCRLSRVGIITNPQ